MAYRPLRWKKRIGLRISHQISSVFYFFRRALLLHAPKDGLQFLVYHTLQREELVTDEWSIPVSQFSSQMAYLKEAGYQVISLDRALTALRQGNSLLQKSVCLTFDDGYKNIYSLAFPILKSHGFPATIFLTTGYINSNKPFPWLLPRSYNIPLTWDEISEMATQNISFGSHSHTHRALTENCPDDLIEFELIKSWNTLKERIPANVYPTFCCPYGVHQRDRVRLIEYLKKGPYQSAFLGRFGTARKGDLMYDLPRIIIYGNDNLNVFKKKLAGAYDWIDVVKRGGYYLKERISRDAKRRCEG